MQADSAPVRPGEELDVAALSSYLLGRVPGAGHGLELRQFPGGHSNLTYLVKAGEHEYVLRRPPFGPVPPKAHDMAREYQLLAAVHPLFPPAPRPVLLCEDHGVMGATFFLMERRHGMILRGPVADDAVKEKASEAFVNCLIQLHAVDASALPIGNPAGFLERQVRGWMDRWQRAQTEVLPEMEAVLPWLTADVPESPAPTLIHNDYKLDNIALNPDDPSKVEAVFDWEMATVGDPLFDLGVALTYWTHAGMPDKNGNPQPPFTAAPGWIDRKTIVEAYEAATGRDLSRIAYYEVFGVFKLIVIIQQIYYRWLKGQTRDPRFAGFGKMVQHLAGKAAFLAERAA